MDTPKYAMSSSLGEIHTLHFNFPVEDDLSEGMYEPLYPEDPHPNLLSWIGGREGIEILSSTRYSMTFTVAHFFDEKEVLACVRSIVEGLGFVLS